MRSRLFRLFIFIVLLLFTPRSFCVDRQVSNKYRDAKGIISGRFRVGFMGVNDLELLPLMSKNGLNTALVVFQEMHSPMTAKEQTRLQYWARSCKVNGLKFIPLFSLWSSYEKSWFTPKYHYTAGGVENINTPCPLEEDNYKHLIHDRMIALARMSADGSIQGAVLDTEMYAGNYMAFTYPCVCDNCWQHFRDAYPDCPMQELSKRERYLQDSGRVIAYRNFAVKRLAQMASKTRAEIDTINPLFVVGATLIDRLNPFDEGLSRGFGTKNNPVIIFSEKTYTVGYSDYISQKIQEFEHLKIPAIFIAGIWQDKFPLENLPEQYYYCAKESAGYWIYQMCSLNSTWKGALRYSPTQYWQAIRSANNELIKLDQDTNYVTSLKIRSFRRLMAPVDFASIKIGNLTYVRPGEKFDETLEPLTFQAINKIVFIAQQGSHIKFRVEFIKRYGADTDYAEVSLITNKGQVLAKEETKEKQDAIIDTVAPYTGPYCIVLNSDKNVLRITGFTHPFSCDASEWPFVHFLRPKSPIYMCKPASSNSAEISFFVNGAGEAVTATLKTETGELIGKYNITAKQVITIPLRETRQEQIIVLYIEPMPDVYFGNVIVTIKSGLERYISPFKSGLVKQIIHN